MERRKMSKKNLYMVGDGAEAMPYLRQKSGNVKVPRRDMMLTINSSRNFSISHNGQTSIDSMPADNPIRVLLIEDNQGDAKLIWEMLVEANNVHFELECFDMLSTGLERLAKGGIDVVLLDLGLPDSWGFETFSKVQALASSVPIVVLTGITDEELALNAMRNGAQDYLLKTQMDTGLLTRALLYAIERKHAEKMLQKKEEHYKTLIGNSQDIIMALDADGTIRYASPSVEKMLGYNPEDVVGEKALEFIHPDDASHVMDFLSGEIQSQDLNEPLEFRVQHKDGSWRILEGSGKSIPDEPETAYVVNARDVTGRKKAEKALKESEEKYKDLFENANDAICIIDSDFNYKDVNKRAVELFGYSKEELLNMNLLDIIPPELIPKSEIESDIFRKKGFYDYFMGKIRTKSGQLIDVEFSSMAIIDGEKFLGSREIILDISERKWMEDALRESEKRYQNLVKLSPAGVFRTDSLGNCVYVNDRFCEFAGINPKQSFGLSWAERIHPDDCDRILDEWNRAKQKNLPFKLEYRFLRRDGVTTWVIGQAVPERGDDGEIIGYIGTVTDITDRKQAEEIRLENERLASANKAKSEFLASISHDVRIPLNTIIGFSELMKQERYGKLNRKHKDYVENVLASGKLLLGLVTTEDFDRL